MLTENVYNYRMDYPGLFLPQITQLTNTDDGDSSTFHYPISPPHHSSSPFDISASSPPRSAFTAVKSSTSGQPNRQSLELLHSLYDIQLTSTSYNHNNLYSTPTTTINYPPSPPSSHNSPIRRPTSAAMIEQLMRRRSSPTTYSEDNIKNQPTYGDHDHDQRLVVMINDGEDHHHQHQRNKDFEQSSSERMARQRQDFVQRTSVIKSVNAEDRSTNTFIRSAVQRQSSDSCGASSASSSSASSSADEEIVCQWRDCFRLVYICFCVFILSEDSL